MLHFFRRLAAGVFDLNDLPPHGRIGGIHQRGSNQSVGSTPRAGGILFRAMAPLTTGQSPDLKTKHVLLHGE
jgi:hypothetical protein